jgi:hypothetical protein
MDKKDIEQISRVNALRAFLGVRNWLYFEMSCNPLNEPIALCRVDAVTSDVEYRHNESDEWTRVVNGDRLKINNDTLKNQWLIGMLEAFYG